MKLDASNGKKNTLFTLAWDVVEYETLRKQNQLFQGSKTMNGWKETQQNSSLKCASVCYLTAKEYLESKERQQVMFLRS